MLLEVLLTAVSLTGSTETTSSAGAAFQAFPSKRMDFAKSLDKDVAVVLIGGLDLRDDGAPVAKPRFQSWQSSMSPLTQTLGKSADVFSYAYGQADAVESVASSKELRATLHRIKKLGYGKLVLLGHSAGGLVARHFVEESSDTLVTAVVQVGAPNAGSVLAAWGAKLSLVPPEQLLFVQSLTPAHRTTLVKDRGRSLPRHVAFTTVVTHMTTEFIDDGVVPCLSQWPRDLQLQGVPCVTTQVKHTEAMEHDRVIQLLCNLIHAAPTRWDRSQVFEKRKELGSVA